MKSIRIGQNVVKLLGVGCVENLIGLADMLLAKVHELAEHVARRKPIRVCHPHEALQHEPQSFGDLPIVLQLVAQIITQQRVAPIVLTEQIVLDNPGPEGGTTRAPDDLDRLALGLICAFPNLAQERL